MQTSPYLEDLETKGASEHTEHSYVEQSNGVPDGYYTSKLFVGTVLALGFGMLSGTGSYAIAAAVISVINNDIGPDPNYVWIGLVNTMTQAVGYTLVGRLSDLCGRRWFVICGNGLGLIGAIVCCKATSIPMVIGGNVLMGLATSVQTSVPFLLGELIPKKHRFIATGMMYFWVTPGSVFGPAIAYGFIQHTRAGWRWIYYFLVITNALATLGWFLFYHPPTFVMLTSKTRFQLVKDFDWIGFILFVGGLVIFLMGLSWGGSVYPWASGHVIGTLVAGIVGLVSFALWEAFMDLKEPIIPRGLFNNRDWVIVSVITALSASVFYGFAIVYPQMIFGIYTSDITYGSLLACHLPGAYVLGVIASGTARYIGHIKIQVMVSAVMSMSFLGAVAGATVDNQALIMGIVFIGAFFAGLLEGIGVTGTSLTIKDQAMIGSGVGIAATMKAVISTIATAIYLVVLRNRMATTIPAEVPPALIGAGLSPDLIPTFIGGLATGTLNASSYAPEVVKAGVGAYKQASVLAFRTVFLTTIAFSGIMVLLSIFWPNLEVLMTSDVVAMLHVKKERDQIVEKIKAGEEAPIHEAGVHHFK